MRATILSGKIHKWLALAMAVPILFWFASGLFFAVVPIDQVRGTHRKSPEAPAPIALAEAATGLARIALQTGAPVDRIELRRLGERPVALLTQGSARPRLYDLTSGRLVSPLSAATATTIAERDLSGTARAVAAGWVTTASPEYRGPLPAWRIDFADTTARSLYVAADTGAVTARRSTLWRVYDFLWSLHILDLKDHEDFNTPLLVIAALLAMIVLVTGVILMPRRLGYLAWRQRRRGAARRGVG